MIASSKWGCGKGVVSSFTARSAHRIRSRGARAQPAVAGWLWSRGNGSSDKVIHLIRHGQTEMNVWLGQCPAGARYGEPGFYDPMIFDTRLTSEGVAQAAAQARRVARLAPEPQVVVVSPLTRALQTADIMFDGLPFPRLVHPLPAERLYLSSDVGKPRQELEAEFPHHCFQELPMGQGRRGAWWHTCDRAEEDLRAVTYEPDEVFLRRVERLRQWLAARPEQSLAVVTHWGVLEALTGKEFHNCEVATFRLRQLRARPHLLPAGEEPAAAAAGAAGREA